LWQEREIRYEQRFQAQEKAVLKAEAAFEERLKNTNEWRQTINDRDSQLISRSEVEGISRAFNDKSELRFTTNSDKIETGNKTISERITVMANLSAERMAVLQLQIQAISSASQGAKDQTDNSRANIAIFVSIGTAVVMMADLLIHLTR